MFDMHLNCAVCDEEKPTPDEAPPAAFMCACRHTFIIKMITRIDISRLLLHCCRACSW